MEHQYLLLFYQEIEHFETQKSSLQGELVDLKDKIEEVFFFGSAWDRCVKLRPLGYDMWLNNTSANLYFDPDGVQPNPKDPPPKFEEYQNSKKYPNLKTLREV